MSQRKRDKSFAIGKIMLNFAADKSHTLEILSYDRANNDKEL